MDSEQYDSLSLSDIVPSDWDRVFFFGEYTGAQYVTEATGLKYSGDVFGLFDHVPEHHDLVVFSLDGNPLCHELISVPGIGEKGWGFGSAAFSRSGIARSDAVFRIERAGPIRELELVDAAGSK